MSRNDISGNNNVAARCAFFNAQDSHQAGAQKPIAKDVRGGVPSSRPASSSSLQALAKSAGNSAPMPAISSSSHGAFDGSVRRGRELLPPAQESRRRGVSPRIKEASERLAQSVGDTLSAEAAQDAREARLEECTFRLTPARLAEIEKLKGNFPSCGRWVQEFYELVKGNYEATRVILRFLNARPARDHNAFAQVIKDRFRDVEEILREHFLHIPRSASTELEYAYTLCHILLQNHQEFEDFKRDYAAIQQYSLPKIGLVYPWVRDSHKPPFKADPLFIVSVFRVMDKSRDGKGIYQRFDIEYPHTEGTMDRLAQSWQRTMYAELCTRPHDQDWIGFDFSYLQNRKALYDAMVREEVVRFQEGFKDIKISVKRAADLYFYNFDRK